MEKNLSYDKEAFTEEELTFLDDVPDYQVDEFIKFVAEDNDETNVVKWYFSNPNEVMGFMKARYDNVVEYFTYLRHLEKSGD